MVRAYSNQGVQLGVETTPGTPVDATKRLMAYRVDPQPVVETATARPSGYKVPTVASLVSESTEAEYEGPIDYNNIVYPLSSLFGAAVISQPDDVDAPNAYQWTWSYTGKGATTPKTFTVEVGDAARAVTFDYGVFSSMEMEISRTGDNTISGSMLGRRLTTNATMTNDPTEIEIVPVNGDHWDVFADDAGDNLGDTQLTAVYEASLSFSDLFAAEYALNSAQPSFTSLFDSEEPAFEWGMTLGADEVAEAYLTTNVRNSAKKFIRLQATGASLGGDVTNLVQIDMCVVVTEFDSFQSSDGLYVLPITFSLAYDANWGKAMAITVINEVDAL